CPPLSTPPPPPPPPPPPARLTFDRNTIGPDSFAAWQAEMKAAMAALMRHPDAPSAPAKLLKRVKRDGYTLEKWESYPLDSTAVPFLVLVPDAVNAGHPAPGVLCIPGFGQTKELLAGEKQGDFALTEGPDSAAVKNTMALDYVKAGLVAVAVDNPSCGELSDNGHFDYLDSSRFLLECGWSYLGLSSWQDRVILDWMKEQPFINPQRIIVSGFSLGTEPMMALGLLDDSIYAFVYNDFLCRTRERALVMDKPNKKNARPFPNSIEHLIPGFLLEFDFPDIVAALAPRPAICTEGGMDRDFSIIEAAYATDGAPQNFEWHHYPKYADPSTRVPLDAM
ncbi:MAG: alpha/beta hydrolase family protein, partial [Muribaculaceae bacterium]|nr:alpha/beta hydrolase family protein [Muribaculaceae bacterium]